MADGNRTTVIVAVAGIAATALVGLAGTTAAWLSARDDRAAQRTLARDERTYDRRVSAYLDAMDFVEGQKTSFDRFWELGPYDHGRIPYHSFPPSRLTSRLRAFGSAPAFKAFQKTEKLSIDMPIFVEGDEASGREVILGNPFPQAPFRRAYTVFKAQILHFEDTVHAEVG